MIKWFLLYLAAINVLSAVLTITDKYRARRGKWRIRESTLILAAVLGGSPAEYITMRLIRHKTRHKKFMIGLPAIFLIQAAAAALAVYYFYFR